VLNASWDAWTERHASLETRIMALVVGAAVLRCGSRSAIVECVTKS
jgi:hypothetical protein